MKNDMQNLVITSPDFEPEGWMPDHCGGYGEDQSPQLRVEGMDARAVALAVTLDDLGHPIRPGYNHWVAWNLPPVCVIPGNLPKGAAVDSPIHLEQGLAYGKHRYRGPKPPFNWNHRYRFTVYVLDAALTLGADSDKAEMLKAMEGHILQTGCLYGKYQRKHR